MKSDTSAYLLERVFPLSEGLRAECFFFPFVFFSCYSSPLRSTLLIKDHAYPPRRVLQHYNSPPQVQLSWVLHFFSSFSLSALFLLSALPPSHLLVILPVRQPSFHVPPTPYPSLSPSLHLYLLTFTLVAHNRRPCLLRLTLLLSHLPSAYASAYFEVVAHNRYSILMRTLMNF